MRPNRRVFSLVGNDSRLVALVTVPGSEFQTMVFPWVTVLLPNLTIFGGGRQQDLIGGTKLLATVGEQGPMQ